MTPRPQVQPRKCSCMGCVDRILPKDLMRFHPNQESYSGRIRALSPIGRAWLNGTTLQVRFLNGTDAQKELAAMQAQWWAQNSNIRFNFNQSPQADIRVSFNPADGAWSYIGTDCKSIPSDQPTMNLGFLDGGTAGHEFGHAIGLLHEHQNPQGGIQWNKEVVLRELSGPPNYWDEATIWHNVFDKYSADQVNGTGFDPKSIMLYSFPASWTINGFASQPNNVLSELDKSFVASAKMYPKDKPTVANAVDLVVDAPLRTKAEIGEAGEEDIFHFVISKPGRYLVDTFGWTDVVMRLFGPNSETALMAEDDDSGVYLNSKINIDLIAGHYYVQIRHFNKTSGMGSYSIRVATV